MNENDKIFESALLISKDFGISQSEFGVEEKNKLEYSKLMKELIRVINYLLNHDFQKLLNGLYRIDVSEQKVSEILEVTHSDQIAKEISNLILKRELQKVETRIKYKKQT